MVEIPTMGLLPLAFRIGGFRLLFDPVGLGPSGGICCRAASGAFSGPRSFSGSNFCLASRSHRCGSAAFVFRPGAGQHFGFVAARWQRHV
ncbi:MAG: hypothetical protein AAFR70_09770 [Pseudomonadota bacterium]